MDKSIFFKRELATYENEDVKHFSEILRDNMMDIIYIVPSSTSVKHHASYELGEGGCYRHLCAVTRLINHFLSIEQYHDQFTSRQRDLLRLSAQYHDSVKVGENGGKDTVPNHPTLGAEWVLRMNKENGDILNADEIMFVYRCIQAHMGQWNTDRSGNVILPKPVTLAEQLIHLADYLGSRKDIEIKFDEDEIIKPTESTAQDFIMPFGKYKNEKLGVIPTDYLNWMWNNLSLQEPLQGYIRQILGR